MRIKLQKGNAQGGYNHDVFSYIDNTQKGTKEERMREEEKKKKRERGGRKDKK